LDMILYGLHDVHFLLKLRKLLIRDLTRRQFYDTRDDEAQLVAQSFALTLQQFDYADEYDEVMPSGCRNVDDKECYFTPNPSFGDDVYVLGNENNIDNADLKKVEVRQTKASAAELRLEAKLMTVLTQSQYRCRDLWSGGSEAPLKNSVFVSLVKRAKRGELPGWHEQGTQQLYLDLVEWRNAVARELECVPDFVSALDFLAIVAWKRPRSRETLRRISWDWPEALNDEPIYLNRLLEVVRESSTSLIGEGGQEEEEEIYLYYSGRKNGKGNDGGALKKVALATSAVATVSLLAFLILSTTRKRTRFH